jgi:DNA end-binding protein Ku
VSLYPATSEREKVSFHQINKKTGNRVRLKRVDEETGHEVPYEEIIKGYEISKGHYIEVEPEELEAIALESTRTIDIDEFVPKSEIDELYNIRPYYIAPNDKVGADAFAVIRDIIKKMEMTAIGRVVLTNREHIIAIEPRGKGLMGTLLRYPYEVRDADDYFDDIPAGHVTKDMLDLAAHIVKTKSGHFKPERFEDHYEHALKELLRKKQHGQKIEAPEEPRPAKVINLMDALRRSVQGEADKKPPAASRTKRRASGKRTRRSTAHHRKAS